MLITKPPICNILISNLKELNIIDIICVVKVLEVLSTYLSMCKLNKPQFLKGSLESYVFFHIPMVWPKVHIMCPLFVFCFCSITVNCALINPHEALQ